MAGPADRRSQDGSEQAPREDVVLPRLGLVGGLRFIWTQLTTMRVALMLLALLAVAALPGSILPQRPIDPAAVADHLDSHPDAGPWLDRLGFYDVYTSVWFSAIYLLLFVSLVGCIVPRVRHHLRALRSRPPRTPRRLDRLPAHTSFVTAAPAPQALEAAHAALRRRRFRADVREDGSVAAENGYAKETGNLLFHVALVGLLLAVAYGSFFSYRGQAVVIEGRGFSNTLVSYDSFDPGTLVDPDDLPPFTFTFDSFTARFEDQVDPSSAQWAQPRDFEAGVTVSEAGEPDRAETIRLNDPLDVEGAHVYLTGNGYAPVLTVRDADGVIAFQGPRPFLPQDTVYTSQGVVKIPDVTSGPQLGIVGYLLPTYATTASGAPVSVWPEADDPVILLSAWSGDLGLDDGVPQNDYRLDTEAMTQMTTASGAPFTASLRIGETAEMPDGSTISFDGLDRFVALDLRHDPSNLPALVTASLAIVGLCGSLFVSRRRVWVRAVAGPDGRTLVEVAGLARGEDGGLAQLVQQVAQDVRRTTGAVEEAGTPATTG